MQNRMSQRDLEHFEFLNDEILKMVKEEKLIEIPKPDKPTKAIVLYYDKEGGLHHSASMDYQSYPRVTSVWVNKDYYDVDPVIKTHFAEQVPSVFGEVIKYYKEGPTYSFKKLLDDACKNLDELNKKEKWEQFKKNPIGWALTSKPN